MTNWQTKTIGDVATIISGGTPDTTKSEYWNGNIQWITPSEITKIGRKIIEPTEKQITEAGLKASSATIVPAGSIILCSRATIGECAINIYPITTNQGFKNLVAKSNADINFLYYWVKASKKNLFRISSGSTFLEFSKHDLEKQKIDIPEPAEQERIVGVLEVWDEYIEKLEQKIALKEQLKKGLMQQLLIGKRRLPGFSKEWKAVKMNELGNTYSGLTGKTKDDFGSGEPFITYMNIYSNPVLNTKNMQLVHIGENERQSIAEYGDIFFTTSSETPDEVGISSVLLDKSDQNIYLNSFCFGFRMHNLGTLEPRFAAYYFRSSIFRKKMTRIAQGASRYNLSKKYFMETEIRVPELDEQLAIVVLLENIDKQIAVHSVQYKNLKFQKKYLLKNLITGTIRTPEDLKSLDTSRLERRAL